MKNSVFVLALMGAVVATICDANHVFTGALAYPDEGKIGIQAWWVFPGFFVAFLVMGVLYKALADALPEKMSAEKSASPGSLGAMVEALSAFMMVYLASGFGNAYPVLLNLTFLALFVVRLLATYERAFLLVIAIPLAIDGMVVEAILGHFGLVAYAHQDIFYVPFWLGGVYLHGAFALREAARFFLFRDADAETDEREDRPTDARARSAVRRR